MSKFDELKHHLKLGTAALAVTAATASMLATSTLAQDKDKKDDEEELVEEVVVTGSRIARAGFDTVQPATVVDSDFMDARGFDNVAKALNELPGFFPGLSPTDGQSSQSVGQNFVNAFGLGTQRTLTLINGRRTVGQNTPTLVGSGAASGLQVDMNIIPTALIDRVETVFTGGAPIYGSDAIAGTVNLILKDDFQGLSAEAQYGISERGDAEEYRMRTTFGGNFNEDRGNAVFTVEYSSSAGMIMMDRPELVGDFRTNCSNPNNGNSSDGIVDERICADGTNVWQLPTTGFILPNNTLPFALPGGSNLLRNADGDAVMFGLNGGLVRVEDIGGLGDPSVGNPGIFFSQGLNGRDNPYFITIDGEDDQLRAPLERFNMMMLGHYDVTDNIRFFTEAMYSRSESRDNVNQPSWATEFFAPGQGAFRINIADNPFVSTELRDLLELNGGYDPTNPDAQYFTVTRTNSDFTIGDNFREQNVFRIVTGLEGDFDLMERNWKWEVAYTFGQTHATTSQVTQNFERMALGIDVVAITEDQLTDLGGITSGFGWRGGQEVEFTGANPALAGDIVCRSRAEGTDITDQAGSQSPLNQFDRDACVPINIFGFGLTGDAGVDYVLQKQIQRNNLQQSVVEANINGELFDLPAGPIGAAFGFTHRRERGEFEGGQGSEIGVDPNAPISNVKGGFNTTEFYSELFVPISGGGDGLLPSVFESFSIEGAARHVNNNFSGKDWTWTLGGRMTPHLPGKLDAAITFRGNYTQAIRSPSIPELFAPRARVFSFASDPCDNRFIDQGNNPTVRRANCEAEFAAAQAAGNIDAGITLEDYQAIIANASQPGFAGGSQTLANEQSKAWSVGVIIEPDQLVPGLTISADWTDIKITDAIVSPTATQLANACYDNDEYPNVILGASNACDTFSREAGTFQYVNPITDLVNAATRTFSGLTVNASYDFDLAAIKESLPGNLRISGNYFYLNEDQQNVFVDDLDVFTSEIGNEQHTWNVNFMYTLDKFQSLLQWRHIGSSIPSNEFSDERRDVKSIPSWNVWNLTLRYQLTDNVGARFVVNNLLNNRGLSRVERAYLNARDEIGRTFLFAVTFDF